MKKAEDGYAVLTINNCIAKQFAQQLQAIVEQNSQQSAKEMFEIPIKYSVNQYQNSQQSAKEMFEIPIKYPVNEAVAVLTARVSVSVTDGLWHFVEDFTQQFAYNCLHTRPLPFSSSRL